MLSSITFRKGDKLKKYRVPARYFVNPLWLLVISLILTAIIYAFGLGGAFLYDDYSTIVNNDHIKIDSLTYQSLNTAIWSFDHPPFYRPISMLTFALNHYFTGMDPSAFKAVNLSIHLLSGIGIYLLLTILFKSINPVKDNLLIHLAPIIITTAWLLNPINLTTVLYIVQRMTGLASLFMIFGTVAYTWGRYRLLNNLPGNLPLAFSFFIFFPLAFLSKENGALLILYILLIEILFFRFRSANEKFDSRVLLYFSIFAFLPGLILTISLVLNPDLIFSGYTHREFTLTERLLTECRALWLYIRLILLPNNQLLGMYHDDFILSLNFITPLSTVLAVTGALFLPILAIALAKKHPLFSFGIFWFFISHLLESSFVPLELIHEHRNYLASLGILIAVIGPITQNIRSKKSVKISIIFLSLFIFTTATITLIRATTWGNNFSHAMVEAFHHPNSPRANLYAGNTLLRISHGNPPALNRASNYFEKVRKLDERDITPEISLILSSQEFSLPLKQEWLSSINIKLKKYPITPSVLFSLKELYKCQKNGVCDIPHEKISEIFKIAAESNDYRTNILYGSYLQHVIDDIYASKKQYEIAIHRAPNQAIPHLALTSIYIYLGDWKKAQNELIITEKNDINHLHHKEITKAKKIILHLRSKP